MKYACVSPSLLLSLSVMFYILHESEAALLQVRMPSQQPSLSPLVNTKWKVRLDIGFQPGSWMPKRFPGWAESGARLLLDTDVIFSKEPSQIREGLVGPKDQTYVLQVCGGPSRFVSEKGEQQVTFTSGGWCIQRPTNNIKNVEGSLVKPEGLLRFWLDCSSGAKRRDVEILPSTRIFFTTGVWDDPKSLQAMETEYETVLNQLTTVVDNTRETRGKEEDTNNNNVIEQVMDFRKLVGNAQEFDRLQARKQELERLSPPRAASKAPTNGVQIAPTGSLVIKGNKIPDWLPGSEYLILGTFSTKSLNE